LLGNHATGTLMKELIRDAEITYPRGFGISEPMRKKARRLEQVKLEAERPPIPARTRRETRSPSSNGNGNGHTELTPELRRELKQEVDRRRRPIARKLDRTERAVEKERRKLELEEQVAA
jgi:hypothetical protein